MQRPADTQHPHRMTAAGVEDVAESENQDFVPVATVQPTR
jgi:hypothetical protein